MYPWDMSSQLFCSSVSPCWTPWWVGSTDDELITFSMASSSNNADSGGGKRSRAAFESLSEERYWNRYLVLAGKDDDDRFPTLSAISLYNNIIKTAGHPDDMRRLTNGSLLVKAGNRTQADLLQKLSVIGSVPVTVLPHRSLNTCKGTVVSRESHTCTDVELREFLKDHGVLDVQRIALNQKPLQLLILTFQGTILPDRVPVAFEVCRTRPYIPNPRRCYNCQRYGHITKYCKKPACCARCGSVTHTHTKDSPCEEAAHCVNCQQDHPAFDRKCPVWITEKEVQRLKVTKDINFPQARKLVQQTQGPINFSAVVNSTSHQQTNSPKRRLQLDPHYKFTKYGQSSHADSLSQQSSPSSQPSFSNANDLLSHLAQPLTEKSSTSLSLTDSTCRESMDTGPPSAVGVTEGSTSAAVKNRPLGPGPSQVSSSTALTKTLLSKSSSKGVKSTTNPPVINRKVFQRR